MPKSDNSKPHAARFIAFLAALVSGIFVAVQSRINGELGLVIGDGITAALISFGSGWLIILVALALSARARKGLRRLLSQIASGEVPIWIGLGGAAGGFLVMTQGLTAGLLGIALFTVAVVAGQTLGSLLIDWRGLAGMPKTRLSAWRLGGAGLSLIGAVAASITAMSLEIGWQLALPLLGGIGLGFQQAVNGRVRSISESAITATFVNFTVGTLTIAAVKLASLQPLPASFPDNWLLYLGGLMGVLFIAVQSIVVIRIGVLALGVALVAGQLIGSLALDILVPVAALEITPLKLAGILITLVGALMVSLAPRR